MASSPAPKGQSSEYYYFVVGVAAIAVLLLVTNVLALGCCARCGLVQAALRLLRSRGWLRGGDEDGLIPRLIPASKYRKEQAQAAEGECSVCLSAFVEGEEVRQMPKCRHCFHAPCIDMWLYSHSNCPLCRANVLPENLRCTAARPDPRLPGSMTGVVVALL